MWSKSSIGQEINECIISTIPCFLTFVGLEEGVGGRGKGGKEWGGGETRFSSENNISVR